MTGSVLVKAPQENQKALYVPESALAAEPDGSSFVWVVDPNDNSATKRKVTPTSVSDGTVSITGEIAEGNIVVTAGVSFLREGMIVKSMTAEME